MVIMMMIMHQTWQGWFIKVGLDGLNGGHAQGWFVKHIIFTDKKNNKLSY